MGLGKIHNINLDSFVFQKKIPNINSGFIRTVIASVLFVTIFTLISANQAYATFTVVSFDDANVDKQYNLWPLPFYFIGHGTSIKVDATLDSSICSATPPSTIPVTLKAEDSSGAQIGSLLTLNFVQDNPPGGCIYHLPGYVQLSSTGQTSSSIPRLQVVNGGFIEVTAGTDGLAKAGTINTDPWGSYGSNPNQPNKTVKIHCAHGNSKDAICPEWKVHSNGGNPPDGLTIPYTVTGTTYTYHWDCTDSSATHQSNPALDFPCPDPNHYDVYVEVDWMEGQGPNPTVIQDVINAFKTSVNPDGSRGITLHVLLDDNIGFHKYKITGPGEGDDSGFTDYNLIKRANFGTLAERTGANVDKILTAKRQVFHYALFAVNQSGTNLGYSGRSEMPLPPASGGGNDMLISLGAFTGGVGSLDEQKGTFMHELGHNLDLNHGGPASRTDNATNCKPNYLSVMSYSRQFSDLFGQPGRPLNYSGEANTNFNVIESATVQDPSLTNNPNQLTVYNDGSGRPSQPMNANIQTTFTTGNVALNNISTNKFSCSYPTPPANKVLVNNDDWHNLKFNFTYGSSDFADGAGAGIPDDFAGGAGPNYVAYGELNDYHPEYEGKSLLFWTIVSVGVAIAGFVGIMIYIKIREERKKRARP